MQKIGLLVCAGAIFATAAVAEPEYNRSLFCRENRLPAPETWELGLFSQYQRLDEGTGSYGKDYKSKDFTVQPYARYGLLENFAVFANLPFGTVNSDSAGKHTGIRDISFGFELLAYEHTFGYPYIMPYVEFILATGDEDHKLGRGQTDAVFGAATGTTVYDIYHYVLDGRYNVNYGDEDDGVFSLAAAFIWDLSEQFSLIAEAKGTSEDIADESGLPLYFRGGMYYKVNDQLNLSWYGGGSINAKEDGMGAIKIGYFF